MSAAVPGLSALLAWPTEHLTEAADYWQTIGGRCYGVANHVWRDALSVDWQGAGAEALRAATHADMLTTSAVADQLQSAANVARSADAGRTFTRCSVRGERYRPSGKRKGLDFPRASWSAWN